MSQSNQPRGGPGGGKPVSILKLGHEKVTIDTRAINAILEKVGDSPFAVYSINGPKRTGKSFMLTNFVRYLNHAGLRGHKNNAWIYERCGNSFVWRAGADRETTGINVWSELFWINKDGRRIAVILMDTQGQFDDQSTLQQNAIVFAISTLLSSVLIFNIMRDVGEDMLQNLHFFSSFATMTIPDKDCNGGSGRSAGAFQKLVFLLRDFQFLKDYKLGYYDNITVPDGQDYRKNFKRDRLDSKPHQPVDVRHTHDQVCKSYQEVGVYLMPEPDKRLKQTDLVDNLDQEFEHHLSQFVQLMLSSKNLVTKKMGGVEVSGKEMISYVNSWARLFEGGDLPAIRSVYHSAAESQFMVAKNLAVTFYSSVMNAFLDLNDKGVTDGQLKVTHCRAIAEAFLIYKGRRQLGGSEYDTRFENDFETESSRLFQTYQHVNERAAEHQKFIEDCKKQEALMKKREEENELRRKKMEEDIRKLNTDIHERRLDKLFNEMHEKLSREKENCARTLGELRERDQGGSTLNLLQQLFLFAGGFLIRRLLR